MAFKIIADSCCDLPLHQNNKDGVILVPLKITLDDVTYIDDGTINIPDYLAAMKRSKNAPASACPSPSDFSDAIGSGHDDVFIVTMSAGVSATYQSAVMAADMRTHGKTHVFDSHSASSGEVLIVREILARINEGKDFDTIVSEVEEFINGLSTFFVLQSLDNLIKAGRISRIKGQVASILNLRPIMGEKDGTICMIEKARGTIAAMEKLVEITIARVEEAKTRTAMVIAHCNCLERAQDLKQRIMSKTKIIKDILIVETGGLSTNYANDGGVIIAL